MAINTAISPQEQARRQRAVAAAIHNGEMENLPVDEQTRADMNEYASGRITVSELVERGRVRLGLN